MHRTAALHLVEYLDALHLVEYLEIPPSTNGIPFFAAGVQVQSSTHGVAARGLSLISVPRLHATSLGTRTGLLLFFWDKAPSVRDRGWDPGQDKEFRDCPGRSGTRSGTLGNYAADLDYLVLVTAETL